MSDDQAGHGSKRRGRPGRPRLSTAGRSVQANVRLTPELSAELDAAAAAAGMARSEFARRALAIAVGAEPLLTRAEQATLLRVAGDLAAVGRLLNRVVMLLEVARVEGRALGPEEMATEELRGLAEDLRLVVGAAVSETRAVVGHARRRAGVRRRPRVRSAGEGAA